jgi:hypothetical protein
MGCEVMGCAVLFLKNGVCCSHKIFLTAFSFTEKINYNIITARAA